MMIKITELSKTKLEENNRNFILLINMLINLFSFIREN
jgi:hypothetical protein